MKKVLVEKILKLAEAESLFCHIRTKLGHGIFGMVKLSEGGWCVMQGSEVKFSFLPEQIMQISVEDFFDNPKKKAQLYQNETGQYSFGVR